MGRLFAAHPVKYLYVVDGDGLYQGVVPLRALTVATAEQRQSLKAADLLSQEIQPLGSDMGLEAAFQRFLAHQGERLPVVQSVALPRLLGVVRKSALLQTYAQLSF